MEGIQSNKTGEVQFLRISAGTGEVSIDRHKVETPTVQSILDHLNVGGNQELQKRLASLVAKNLFIFGTEDKDLGQMDRVQHETHFTDDVPVMFQYYPTNTEKLGNTLVNY